MPRPLPLWSLPYGVAIGQAPGTIAAISQHLAALPSQFVLLYSMGMTEDASKTDPITRIRAMLSSADRGSLATNQRDMDGWPYASLVMMAVDEVGAPLLLISTLADHTRNLMEDPRASLLIDATVGLEEPLTGARATVLGHLEKSDAAAHRQAYLQRHPSASMYAGFTDFAIWRMTIKRAHLVAGFGDIHWVDWPQG